MQQPKRLHMRKRDAHYRYKGFEMTYSANVRVSFVWMCLGARGAKRDRKVEFLVYPIYFPPVSPSGIPISLEKRIAENDDEESFVQRTLGWNSCSRVTWTKVFFILSFANFQKFHLGLWFLFIYSGIWVSLWIDVTDFRRTRFFSCFANFHKFPLGVVIYFIVHESMFQSHVLSCVFDLGVMTAAPVETWHADGWVLILQDLYRGMKIPRLRNENVMLRDGAGR